MEFANHKVFNQGPPNLDDMFKKWLNGPQKPGSSSAKTAEAQDPKFFAMIAGALAAVWFLSGFFVVKPAEEATVLTFGKYSNTYGQGIHWAPKIISSVYIVDTQKIMTLNHTSEMLTADENIVDVSISVWYRVADPKQFLFHVAKPVLSIQEASASALRQVIGGTSLDQILTTGRNKVMADTKQQLIDILKPYETGLEITEVNLLPAKPPEQVTAAFDDAIKAREDEQKYINQAKAYAEKVEPKAQGAAARIERQAKADAEKFVLQAKADIAPYNALVAAYKKQPYLTSYRLYYRMLGNVLNKVNKIVAEDPSALKMILTPGHFKDLPNPNLISAITDEQETNSGLVEHKPELTATDKRLDYSMLSNLNKEKFYE